MSLPSRTTPLVLTDVDIQTMEPRHAVEAMLQALRQRAAGSLASPARVDAPFDDGRLVMTAGRSESLYGYRIYDTFPTSEGQQVVVIHDRASGAVRAIHVGNALGTARTGALGGAALSLLGPKGPATVAIIGAGGQAKAQLWAASGVLDVEEVRIASRTQESSTVLARHAREDLRLTARAVESAREAVAGADVVILATSSSVPVIDAAWLAQDVFVTTMGPKQVGRCEFPLELVTDADLVVTDSPDQLRAYSPPTLIAEAGLANAVVDLAELTRGDDASRRTGRRVYLSVGLAGTEVELLGRLGADHAAD